MQAALDTYSWSSVAAAQHAKLKVSLELLSPMVNLTFWLGDYGMLEEGLHPLRTVNNRVLLIPLKMKRFVIITSKHPAFI